MGNIHVKFGPVVQQEMSFKDISYLATPLFSGLEPFVQFWKKASCEIILKSGPLVQEAMLFKGISYLELWQPFCSAERNHLCNFGTIL